jgi:hypothetical protein
MRAPYLDSAKLLPLTFFNVSANDLSGDIPGGANVVRLGPEVFLSTLLLEAWELLAKVFGAMPLE